MFQRFQNMFIFKKKSYSKGMFWMTFQINTMELLM
jgi:hypothetical protein